MRYRELLKISLFYFFSVCIFSCSKVIAAQDFVSLDTGIYQNAYSDTQPIFSDPSEVEDNISLEELLQTLSDSSEGETILNVVSDETNWCIDTNNYAVPCWVHPVWVRIPTAKWVWKRYFAKGPEECTIVKEFEIPENLGQKGTLYFAADNFCDVWINDVYIGNSPPLSWKTVTIIDVTSSLQNGTNTIKIRGRNENWCYDPYMNPAGIIYKLVIEYVLKENHVFIDPGHGGEKSGAGPSLYGEYEKDLNLDMGNKLFELVYNTENYTVYASRCSDRAVSVEERVERANKEFNKLVKELKKKFNDEKKAAEESRKRFIFVSIHCNSDTSGTGTEAYYFNDTKFPDRVPKSIELGEKLTQQISQKLSISNRGVKLDTQSAPGQLYVLRQTKMSAILVETAFITGDAYILHYNKTEIAQSLYEGIKMFFGQQE
ncbi:MAG: N-acetylmuramoyl-L-alanine amidase [Candidatus Omnitrophota bacterium]